MRPGLERVSAALSALGEPQRAYRVVHVAGTNGKGSTSAMVASGLRAAGFSVGLYTSPHLCRFTERITVNGAEIEHDSLSPLVDEILREGQAQTFFEVATCAALAQFRDAAVDIAVVEVGLGGRLDATNVVDADLCAITPIGLDHQEVLGDSIAAVAAEKAGIVGPGASVVAAAGTEAASDVVGARCAAVGATVVHHGRDFALSDDGGFFWLGPRILADVTVPLAGDHQRLNAAVALGVGAALADRGVTLDLAAFARGLEATRWPGRLEWIGDHLLDAAHNADAARALAAALGGRDVHLIAGLLLDKDPEAVLGPLLPNARRITIAQPAAARGADPAEVVRRLGCGEIAPSVAAALDATRDSPWPRLVTGSAYVVGEARALLLKEATDPTMVGDPR